MRCLLISPIKASLRVGPAVSPAAAVCHRSHQMPAARTHDLSCHGPTYPPRQNTRCLTPWTYISPQAEHTMSHAVDLHIPPGRTHDVSCRGPTYPSRQNTRCLTPWTYISPQAEHMMSHAMDLHIPPGKTHDVSRHGPTYPPRQAVSCAEWE